jgi:hypothetical protein
MLPSATILIEVRQSITARIACASYEMSCPGTATNSPSASPAAPCHGCKAMSKMWIWIALGRVTSATVFVELMGIAL